MKTPLFPPRPHNKQAPAGLSYFSGVLPNQIFNLVQGTFFGVCCLLDTEIGTTN